MRPRRLIQRRARPLNLGVRLPIVVPGRRVNELMNLAKGKTRCFRGARSETPSAEPCGASARSVVGLSGLQLGCATGYRSERGRVPRSVARSGRRLRGGSSPVLRAGSPSPMVGVRRCVGWHRPGSVHSRRPTSLAAAAFHSQRPRCELNQLSVRFEGGSLTTRSSGRFAACGSGLRLAAAAQRER
jgi:hypothetical protein